MSKVVECKLMLLIHLTGMSVLPPLDEDHRFKTPNLHGFSDTRLNVTQRKFVRSAVQDTKDKPEGPDGKVPLALDLGGGYGDCILAIRKRGGNILYIDRSETEAAAASDRLSSLDLPPPRDFRFLGGTVARGRQ